MKITGPSGFMGYSYKICHSDQTQVHHVEDLQIMKSDGATLIQNKLSIGPGKNKTFPQFGASL